MRCQGRWLKDAPLFAVLGNVTLKLLCHFLCLFHYFSYSTVYYYPCVCYVISSVNEGQAAKAIKINFVKVLCVVSKIQLQNGSNCVLSEHAVRSSGLRWVLDYCIHLMAFKKPLSGFHITSTFFVGCHLPKKCIDSNM